MRLKRTTYVIGIFILTWVTILYFTFLNQSLSINNVNNEIDSQLSKLEKGISQQFKANNEVINAAHKYLDHKNSLKTNYEKPKSRFETEYKGTIIPVLVLACNRISVSRCLDQLIRYRPNPDQFPILVSQVSTLIILPFDSFTLCKFYIKHLL